MRKNKQNLILDDMIQNRENFQSSLKMQKLNAETALGQVARELLVLQNLKAAIDKGTYVKLSLQDGILVVENPKPETVPLLGDVPPRPRRVKAETESVTEEIVAEKLAEEIAKQPQS